jgi:sialate O-acetylesterase
MVLEPAAGTGATADRVALAGPWRYRPGPRLEAVPIADDPNQPTVLYNAMIHPLLGFGLHGVVWYQGESNLVQGLGYEQRLRLLIDGWRRLWGVGPFAFYYVQLAPFAYGPYGFDSGLLPQIWEAQRRVLAVPNTGMVVTTDLGDLTDIHPRCKQEVGRRLAQWALARTYGRADGVCSGPLVVDAVAEANALRLRFTETGTGLAARDGQPLTWFEVAGADSVFQLATARVDGNSIVLTSDAVATPVQARFAWSERATPNLVNREGLPASPFWVQAR